MGRRKSIVAIEGFNHKTTPIPVATRVDNIVYSGGISGYDVDKGDFVDGVEEQVELCFTYVRRTIEAAGGSPDDIVRMTFYMKSSETRKAVNVEWLKMFPDEEDRPARHAINYEMPANKHLICDFVAVLEN